MASEAGPVYAWRRPDPRGWWLVALGWSVFLGAAAIRLGGEGFSEPLIGATGLIGMVLLTIGSALVAGGDLRSIWALAIVGAGAAFGGTFPSAPPALLAVAVAVGAVLSLCAGLRARAQGERLPALHLGLPRDGTAWSVVKADRRRGSSAYVLADARGRTLARVTHMDIPEGADGLVDALGGNTEATARVLMRIDAPDGTPFFYVDISEAQHWKHATSRFALSPSIAVVSTDGGLVGRIESYSGTPSAGGMADGLPPFPAPAPAGHAFGAEMLDATGRPLCGVVHRDDLLPRQRTSSLARYEAFIGPDGAPVAQLDANSPWLALRSMLQFSSRLPQPLWQMLAAYLVTRQQSPGPSPRTPRPNGFPEPYPGFTRLHQPHYARLRAYAEVELPASR